MDRKLRTKRGRTLYRQRGAAVEPVFGQMKDRQGADRFSMRGLECCRSEWQLDAAVHNLRKLHRESVHRAKTKQPSPIRRGVQYGSIGNRLRSSAASLFRSSSSPFLENQATRAPEISRPVGQRPRAGHRTSSPSPTSSALRFASRRGFGSPKGTINDLHKSAQSMTCTRVQVSRRSFPQDFLPPARNLAHPHTREGHVPFPHILRSKDLARRH